MPRRCRISLDFKAQDSSAQRRQKVREHLAKGDALHVVDDVLARHPGVDEVDLVTDDHAPHFVAARHEVFFYLREDLGWSFWRIGKLFGVTHQPVMKAVEKIGRAAGLVAYARVA